MKLILRSSSIGREAQDLVAEILHVLEEESMTGHLWRTTLVDGHSRGNLICAGAELRRSGWRGRVSGYRCGA
jgi:hypothetical protein